MACSTLNLALVEGLMLLLLLNLGVDLDDADEPDAAASEESVFAAKEVVDGEPLISFTLTAVLLPAEEAEDTYLTTGVAFVLRMPPLLLLLCLCI